MQESGKSQHSGTMSKRRSVAIVAVCVTACAASAGALVLSQASADTPPVHSSVSSAAETASSPKEQLPGDSQNESQAGSETMNQSNTSVTVNGQVVPVSADGSTSQTIPTPGGNVYVQVDTPPQPDSTQTSSPGSSSVHVEVNSSNDSSSNRARSHEYVNAYSNSSVRISSH